MKNLKALIYTILTFLILSYGIYYLGVLAIKVYYYNENIPDIGRSDTWFIGFGIILFCILFLGIFIGFRVGKSEDKNEDKNDKRTIS